MIMVKNPGVHIFTFFVAVYAIFSIGHFGGDGYQDYLTAESIVLDGNLSLYDRPDDVDELGYGRDLGVEGADGKIYSARGGLGVPVILAAFYAVGHLLSKFLSGVPHDYITMLAVSFANPVMTALACLLIFIVAGRMGFSRKVATAIGIVYGFSTMAPVYTRTGFAEPAVIVFLLLGIKSAISYKDDPDVKRVLMSAIFIAAMLLCKTPYVILIPCFLIYILWSARSSGIKTGEIVLHISVFLTVITAAIIGLLFFNYLVYGNVSAFGGVDAVVIGKRIAGAPHVLKGIYYYLLSTGKGFFLFNIPVIFAFFSLKKAFRDDKKGTALFLLIFVVNLLFYVKSFRRGSLFSWGPRYLLPSVPVLLLLSGYYLEGAKHIFRKVLYFAGAFAGFVMILPCMFVNQSKFYFFVVEKLRLDEYMINFIPDLSPIKGAWAMLLSRIALLINGEMPPYVYAPDYRLVEPAAASMEQYNYMDIWFLKVIEIAPAYAPLVYAVLSVLAATAVFSAYKIIRTR
ncbi:MAG: hypothetical protein WCV56_00435 [Candidatus Omnitrophota bacterium]